MSQSNNVSSLEQGQTAVNTFIRRRPPVEMGKRKEINCRKCGRLFEQTVESAATMTLLCGECRRAALEVRVCAG